MRVDLEWLELQIRGLHRIIAHQKKLVLKLYEENRPDLAEREQEMLEDLMAGLERLKGSRLILHALRRPPASSRVEKRMTLKHKRGQKPAEGEGVH